MTMKGIILIPFLTQNWKVLSLPSRALKIGGTQFRRKILFEIFLDFCIELLSNLFFIKSYCKIHLFSLQSSSLRMLCTDIELQYSFCPLPLSPSPLRMHFLDGNQNSSPVFLLKFSSIEQQS